MRIYNFENIDYVVESSPVTDRDNFCFDCNSEMKCFGDCCRKSNVFLTPYDIITLKNALGIPSGDFLERYTAMPSGEEFPFPALLLQTEREQCSMIRGDECSVYAHRPLACRLYPLALIPGEQNFHLTIDDFCEGHQSCEKTSISKFRSDYQLGEYLEYFELFNRIISNRNFEEHTLEPVKLEMFYMASYDIDKFREFVFDSIFLQRIELNEDEILLFRNDDKQLLKFAFRWMEHELFGEHSITTKEYA